MLVASCVLLSCERGHEQEGEPRHSVGMREPTSHEVADALGRSLRSGADYAVGAHKAIISELEAIRNQLDEMPVPEENALKAKQAALRSAAKECFALHEALIGLDRKEGEAASEQYRQKLTEIGRLAHDICTEGSLHPFRDELWKRRRTYSYNATFGNNRIAAELEEITERLGKNLDAMQENDVLPRGCLSWGYGSFSEPAELAAVTEADARSIVAEFTQEREAMLKELAEHILLEEQKVANIESGEVFRRVLEGSKGGR